LHFVIGILSEAGSVFHNTAENEVYKFCRHFADGHLVSYILVGTKLVQVLSILRSSAAAKDEKRAVSGFLAFLQVKLVCLVF